MFTTSISSRCSSCCFFKKAQLCHRPNKSRALRPHFCCAQKYKSSRDNTLVTRPNNQRQLSAVLSTTRTRSFTAEICVFSSHLWRCCNVRAYSRIHRDQKQSAMNWACFHYLSEYRSSLVTTTGGKKRFLFCRRTWFGVSGSTSLGSSLEEQIGRLFKIDVTSANTVSNVSKQPAHPDYREQPS